MTYEFRCTRMQCIAHGVAQEAEFPMAATERVAFCEECGSRMEQIITGGAGLIFRGSGWTPKFGPARLSPYDPEKDMESVDRQRKDAGMEPSEWKPKKAVHPIRSQGITISAKRESA